MMSRIIATYLRIGIERVKRMGEGYGEGEKCRCENNQATPRQTRAGERDRWVDGW